MLLILIISAAALVGYFDPKLFVRLTEGDTSETNAASNSTSSNREQARGSSRRVTSQRTGGDAVLVVESPDLFTPEGVEALRHVVSQLEAVPYVRRVTWMDTIPSMNLFGLAEPLFPKSQASPERLLRSKEKALAHPFIRGQLLAPDGETTLILVDFDFLKLTSDEDCIVGLRQVAEAAAKNHPRVKLGFSVTGTVPIVIESIRNSDANRLKYQLIAYGIILLLSVILFRGIAAVVIVAGTTALGVFWTIGFTRFFDVDFNPLVNVILPVLISLVGFTDGVHLMATIRQIRASGASSHDAAVRGIEQVGFACFLTSLTTAIGLGSLVLAHHEIVRDFGAASVVGVAVAFIAVILGIPVGCSTWLGRNLHMGLDKSLIDRNLSRLSLVIDYVLAKRVWFAAVGLALFLILAAIASTLRPDERQANALPRSSEPGRAMAKIDKALGGLEMAEVEVTWTSDRSPEDPELVAVLGGVDEILKREPLVGSPLSILDIVASLSGTTARGPQMSLAELLPANLKRGYLSPEDHRARTTFRVQDLGIATYGAVFQRVKAGLEELQQKHPAFKAELKGPAVWRWENLYQIVVDLLASLGSAFVIIFVVLGMAYRSLRVGIISILPNALPLAVAGVYLVWIGQPLEIVTVCALTVCLGIAVDDTIHFLTRYQEEYQLVGTPDEAIRRAFTGVGTAMIITTIVLVAGFSSVFFSDSRDHILFASLGVVTLGSALFGDLLILPALLSLFDKPVKKDAEGEEEEEEEEGLSRRHGGTGEEAEMRTAE
ncbi:MAG: efflux RND transporter permease subunit [Planctomycetota bacterium]